MKASKELYSELFKEYILSSRDIRELQVVLYGMLEKVCFLLDKYNIDYMLSGGTLLGAIRHSGFIPWDDDVDIMMTRDNYDRFLKYQYELDDDLLFIEPLSSSRYYCKNPKIFKKNTKYVEISNANIDTFDMVFIDIFIIENAPKSKLHRAIRGFFYDVSYKGASVCMDYLFPSEPIINKARINNDLDKYYRLRRILGCIFSHFGGLYFYLRIVDKLGQYRKKTGLYCVPSAISYNREVFSAKIFETISESRFEQANYKIPRYYDIYLKNLYGDYMQIPPIEKREVHVAYKFKLFNYEKGERQNG